MNEYYLPGTFTPIVSLDLSGNRFEMGITSPTLKKSKVSEPRAHSKTDTGLGFKVTSV